MLNFRQLNHFTKTQILSFRFFCRFRQGVWHSVRGSQGEKLLLKTWKYIISERRVGRSDRLGFLYNEKRAEKLSSARFLFL